MFELNISIVGTKITKPISYNTPGLTKINEKNRELAMMYRNCQVHLVIAK